MNKYLLQFQWIKQNESIYKAKANMQSTHVHTHAIEKAEKQDQAKKSIGWMPWHQEPKKDVVNCDKPW